MEMQSDSSGDVEFVAYRAKDRGAVVAALKDIPLIMGPTPALDVMHPLLVMQAESKRRARQESERAGFRAAAGEAS